MSNEKLNIDAENKKAVKKETKQKKQEKEKKENRKIKKEIKRENKIFSRDMTRKQLVLYIAGGILILVILYQIIAAIIPTKSVKLEDGLAVKVLDVANSSISNDAVYSAKLTAEECVPITLTTTGEVKNVYVKLGDTVTKNQILFTIDATALKANVDALSAQYDSARIQAEVSKNSVEMEYNNFLKTYEASKEIYQKGGMSEQEFNSVENTYKTLKMNYDNAMHSYNLIVKGVNDGSYAASASRDSVKAQLDAARAALNDATVRSPINGVVSELNVKENNTLYAGVSPCTIVNMDNIQVELSVSESVISQINKDDKVEITVSSLPNETFEGIITALSPAASNTTGTYPVVISVTSEDERIKPGMLAKVKFFTEIKDEVIVVPKECVITSEDEVFVYIEGKDEDGKSIAVKKLVTTGIDNGESIEIISGVSSGDKLICKGQDYLNDGQKIRVIE